MLLERWYGFEMIVADLGLGVGEGGESWLVVLLGWW